MKQKMGKLPVGPVALTLCDIARHGNRGPTHLLAQSI